jgi:hypothetical protein
LMNAMVGNPNEDGPLGEWHAIYLRDGLLCIALRSYVILNNDSDHDIVAFYS